MQSLCLLLVILVPLSIAAPIETSTGGLQIDIQHADQEVQGVLSDIQALNEAVQTANEDGATLNVEAVNELVADVKEQLENVQNDREAEELKEQLHTVLNDAAEVIETEEAQASPQEAGSLDVLQEAIQQLAEEIEITTTTHSVQERELSSPESLLVATQADTVEDSVPAETIQNDATEDLSERVEILPVLSENNDAQLEAAEIQNDSEADTIENSNDEGSGQEQNDDIIHNENELLNESTPAHDDKTSELIFADQETTHQQIEIEAVDPLAEQLVINIPLRFTVDQVLNRLNRMVFKSPTNERLYIAMKLTEMSHSLMRSVDSEMDETQRIR